MPDQLPYEPRLPVLPPEDGDSPSLWRYVRNLVSQLYDELRGLRQGVNQIIDTSLPASFVTIAASSDLANERVLTAGTGISITDAGAGSTVTIAQAGTVYRPLRPNAAILGVTTSAAAAYVETIGGSAYFPVPGLAFDAATDESAYWVLKALSYGGGNLTLKILWYADTASSGDVIWGTRIYAITPDTDSQDIETKTPATAQTVTDSHLGTVGQRVHTCSVTISNLDSLEKDDYLVVQIYRSASAGGDTMTGDAILVDATLSYAFG